MKRRRPWLWLASGFGTLALVVLFGFWLRPVSYFNGFMYLQESLARVENRTVTVDGRQMHYLAEGPSSGPVVVLIHGLGGRSEDWRILAPYIAQAGFRVYMPDLIGYGRSDRPRDFSYSVRDEAAVVVAFLDSLGLHQVDLGGWSMGGWIVQIVAAAHPERVRRLMLFDSAGLSEKPAWDTNLFMSKTPEELGRLEALLMPHPPRIPGFVAQDVLRISRDHAWVIKRALDTMLTGNDATDRLLPELKMPVMILWGSEDQITPLEEGRKMHELVQQSELDVFNGCGHLAPEQCTGEMGPMIVTFLKQ